MRSTLLSSVAILLAIGSQPVQTCQDHRHGSGGDGSQWTITPEELSELKDLERKWGTDWSFSGIATFAHLKHVKCLTTPSEKFDVGIIGAPFDTATSYRPGARFGPRAIRQASSRQTSFRGFNPRAGINPYASWATIIDCGDIPITPFDNAVALEQMSEAFLELGLRSPRTLKGKEKKPKLITLGGDHSLALPALRALNKVYGREVRVVHFDAHLDTWHPAKYPSAWPSAQSYFNHGSMFWLAGQEGLLSNSSAHSNIHAGLRTRLSGVDDSDLVDDSSQNWLRISADDIDDLGGPSGIIKAILDQFDSSDPDPDPVYLSIDIDVLDPAFAPGTGTPEPGGWTTRELIRILRGLVDELNIVGADVVEVSPAYQGRGEETALAGAHVVYEVLTGMVKRGLKDGESEKAEERVESGDGGHDEL
ncbi:agmatinase [Pseudoneurospora amorphoporcata]|uniref:Agmatinase n=1 Tax=Pseudoneurospora amorphoporcata TaxID=241081 RepID=A0AAN6P318_9PEZI|nr:agmatinase [Pseudoneurospora amorphoporcata]